MLRVERMQPHASSKNALGLFPHASRVSHAGAQTAGKGAGKEGTAGALLACSAEFGGLLLSVFGDGSLGSLKEESHRTRSTAYDVSSGKPSVTIFLVYDEEIEITWDNGQTLG